VAFCESSQKSLPDLASRRKFRIRFGREVPDDQENGAIERHRKYLLQALEIDGSTSWGMCGGSER
jgi:hypothetical protein